MTRGRSILWPAAPPAERRVDVAADECTLGFVDSGLQPSRPSQDFAADGERLAPLAEKLRTGKFHTSRGVGALTILSLRSI
jgi:hypothetical protein